MNEFTFSYWVLRPLWQLYLIWACSTAIIVITSYILVIQPTYQQWTKKQQMIVLQQQTLIQLTQTLETLPQQTELMLELQQLAPTLNDQQHNHIETQITTCLDKTGMKLFSLTQSKDHDSTKWQLILEGTYAQFIDWIKDSYQHLSAWRIDNIDIHSEQESTQFSFILSSD